MLCPLMPMGDALAVGDGSREGRCCRCLSLEEEMKRNGMTETFPNEIGRNA
jgi:hypothetical protein